MADYKNQFSGTPAKISAIDIDLHTFNDCLVDFKTNMAARGILIADSMTGNAKDIPTEVPPPASPGSDKVATAKAKE